MKLITRSAIALVFLIGLAKPLLATNPDVAIRIRPVKNCFTILIKNVRGTPVGPITAVDMTIFDQKNCQRVCQTKMKLQKKLAICQSLDFNICCNKPLPLSYIVYVRVYHNFGMNEEWFFQP